MSDQSITLFYVPRVIELTVLCWSDDVVPSGRVVRLRISTMPLNVFKCVAQSLGVVLAVPEQEIACAAK